MDARAHRFLKSFTAAGRKRLLASLVREEHSAGTYLFREGDPPDGVYLVLGGQIEIVRAAGRDEKILDCMQAGDYLGEVAVLDGHGRSTAARARGKIAVAKIPRAAFLDALKAEPGAVTLGLFRQVLTHLRKADDLIVSEVVNKEKLSLVGEMASSLMHDLRNPVSGIRLSADLIHRAHSDGKIPQWCDGIRLQCDRLLAMAAELMEFSRGESNLDLTQTTTTVFFDQFKNLNDGYLRQAGFDIRFSVEEGAIEVDSMRLLRVVQNLVSNAIEALQNKPKAVIEIGASVTRSTFKLTVRDNGPGIPPAIQGRLFEPFVSQGKSGGTGLGLAIVRNIVTAHRGTITFRTSPGRGTTFLIRLPRRLMEDEDRPGRRQP
jgi:signal transduction histidine kinase